MINALIALLLLASPASAGKTEDFLLSCGLYYDEAKALEFLEKGASISAKDSDGRNCLNWAAEKAPGTALIAALLAKGANVESKNKDGESALYKAVYGDNAATAKLLMEKGADVKTKGRLGDDLLKLAAWRAGYETAGVLLDAGLKAVTRYENGTNPLYLAAQAGNPGALKAFINGGADVNTPGEYGNLPIQRVLPSYYANSTEPRFRECFDLLLAHGANVDAGKGVNQATPLQLAAMPDIPLYYTQALLAKGADPKATANGIKTALHVASENGRRDVAALLLGAGADPDALDYERATPRELFRAKGVDIDALKPFATRVNAYVQTRLDPWLKKDEYESLADYQGRMKGKKAKVAELMGEAFDAFGVWRGALIGAYDAESETFKLSFAQVGDLVVPVPRARARGFKENFSSFRFKPQFADAGKGWALSRLEMSGNGETYVYDAAKQASYAPVVFDVKTGAGADTALAAGPEVKTQVKKVTLAAADDVGLVPAFGAAKRADDVAVVIGVETYRGLPRSAYSKSDAEVMRRYLLALGFQERNIALLLDEKATYIDIKKTLETWLKNVVKPSSRVIVYYSGHGAPDPVSGEGFIVPYDGDPEYLQDTAYPLKKLVAGVGALGAKESVVLLDSCFSGAGGRSVLAKNARPLVAKSQVPAPTEGVALLTASTSDQISSSSEEFGHGLFTYYLLKALKDGKRSLADIHGYMSPLVEDEARRQNARQTPTLSASSGLRGRFSFAAD